MASTVNTRDPPRGPQREAGCSIRDYHALSEQLIVSSSSTFAEHLMFYLLILSLVQYQNQWYNFSNEARFIYQPLRAALLQFVRFAHQ